MDRSLCSVIRASSLRLAPVLVLAAAPAWGQFSSSSLNEPGCDCGGLKLVAASGVPNGDGHSYKFQGICKLLEVSHGSNQFLGFTTSTDSSSTTLGTVWVVAGAKWSAKTGQFTEHLTVQGQYPGEVAMSLKCAQDPVITNGACFAVAYKNTTGWSGFDGPYSVPRPITRGKTTLAEATKFSQQAPKPASTAIPPPPPKPNPTATPKLLHMLSSPNSTVARVNVIPLALNARIAFGDGRALVGRQVGRAFVWVLVGARGETLRTFPAGARAVRDAAGIIAIESAQGSVRLGK
jgi:hypothetical protein